jgi:Family of unknown function (DUF6049)
MNARPLAHPVRRLAAAALATLALALAAAVGTGPAPAGAQTPPQVDLVGQTTWLAPGERFDVRLRIAGAPADAAVRLVVHESPRSRQGFRETLEGDLGDVLSPGTREPLASLTSGPGGTVTAGFVAGRGGVGLPGRGTYPVEAQLLGPGGEVLDSVVTYLTFLTPTAEFPPLAVAMVVDVSGSLALQPDGTVVLDRDTIDRARERADLLAELPGIPLTVAPRPETVEALAVHSDETARIVDALRVDAAGRAPLARPFVDVDLAALQRSGLITEANAQAEGGANVVRFRLAAEPVGGFWMSGPTLGAEAARLAVQLGIGRALVPPSAVDLDADPDEDGDTDGPAQSTPGVPRTPVRLGEGGPLGMVSDTQLAAHLVGDEGAVGTARFVAELTSMWLEAPSIPRGVAVVLPPDATLDPVATPAAVQALTDGQAVRPVTLDQLVSEIPPGGDGPEAVDLAPHEVTDDLRSVARAVPPARESINGLGALLGNPSLASALHQSLLVSTGTDTLDALRVPYVDRVNAALGTVQGAVTLPEEFRITLTSRSSTIPVRLTNASDQNLDVRVELDSDQLEFPDGSVLTPNLPPGTTTLDVPVRVRTSGAFTMDVEVTSPDQSIVLDTSTFDIRSTAISGVGLVLSVGAGLFLAVWWARHWRSARRSRHLMPASSVPPDPPGPPPPPGAAPQENPYCPAHMAHGERARARR